MDWVTLGKAAVMGLVEGVTEFIPVSSTGHLILAGEFLKFEGDVAKTFEVVIQLGAILAIVWLYRAKVIEVLGTVTREKRSQNLLLGLALAFLPAAIVGFLTHDFIKAHLFNPITVAWALVVGGIVILLIEKWNPPTRITDPDAVPPGKALGVGFAQVLSLFPGVSRSGATIMGARVLGFSRPAATEFSFFLAIPTMFAATGYDLLKSRNLLHAADLPIFAVGFVVSFITAVVVVRAFLGYVAKHTFAAFAWYRIVFGAALLLYWGLLR